MNGLLLQLRDKGNTVLVVEHKPETIVIGDHVVDLGPGAGNAGGEICFEGTVEGLKASGTKTGEHLDDRAQLKDAVRSGTGAIEVRGATANNLQAVDVDIPTGRAHGRDGCGWLRQELAHPRIGVEPRRCRVDRSGGDQGVPPQQPRDLHGASRADRKAFAKANGVKPALFSANSEGACPSCMGAGVIITELGFMDTIETPCEDCGGKRFRSACSSTSSRARTSRGSRPPGLRGPGVLQ